MGTATCVAFYKSKTDAMADQNVTHTLVAANGCKDAAHAHGLIAALRAGLFLWTNREHPSNFTIFSIFLRPTGNQHNSDRQVYLHLLTSHSTSLSEPTIKKLAEQSVRAPTDFHGTVDHIKYFAELAALFFGAGTRCPSSLNELLAQIELNKSELKAKIEHNPRLAVKLLYAIDIRVQRFLHSCEKANDMMEVAQLEFEDIVTDILDSKLDRILPPAFYTLAEKRRANDVTKEEEESNEINTNGGRAAKKPKHLGGREGDSNERNVQNLKPNPDFKVNGAKDWKKLCQRAHTRPMWDDTSFMCPRWHSRFYCFSGCRNGASHVSVSADEVPADKNTAYKQYIRSIRS
jgi:hypothetical protein